MNHRRSTAGLLTALIVAALSLSVSAAEKLADIVWNVESGSTFGEKKADKPSENKPDETEPSALDIFERTVKTYAECDSYRDSGTVEVTYIEEDGSKRTRKIRFSTAFVRPDRFRHEFRFRGQDKNERRYIVWHGEGVTRSWWTAHGETRKHKSLAGAMAEATVESEFTSHVIPALLLPEQFKGTGVATAHRVELIDDARLGPIECYRLRAYASVEDSRPKTIWIEKATNLVRRIDKQVSGPDDPRSLTRETTTIFTPVIHGDVARVLLEFNAPE